MLWLLQINFNFLFSGSKASSNAKPWQVNMKTLSQQKPLSGEPPSLNNEAKEEEKAEIATQFDLKRKVDEPPKEVKSKTVKQSKVRIQESKVVDLAQEVGEEALKPEADDRPWRKNMKKPEDHEPGNNNHNFNLCS